MENRRGPLPSSLRIASIAVLAALTFVIGFFVRFPIPATEGTFTLVDLGIFFAAYAFGPFTAAIAGGAGSALFDIVLGFTPAG